MSAAFAAAISIHSKFPLVSDATGAPWTWQGAAKLGKTPPLDAETSLIERCLSGEQAGVQDVHPHRFRHTFADQWLANGGSVDDLMYVAGWSTYDMPLRYARGRGIDRAAQAHARLSPGDRI